MPKKTKEPGVFFDTETGELRGILKIGTSHQPVPSAVFTRRVEQGKREQLLKGAMERYGERLVLRAKMRVERGSVSETKYGWRVWVEHDLDGDEELVGGRAYWPKTINAYDINGKLYPKQRWWCRCALRKRQSVCDHILAVTLRNLFGYSDKTEMIVAEDVKLETLICVCEHVFSEHQDGRCGGDGYGQRGKTTFAICPCIEPTEKNP